MIALLIIDMQVGLFQGEPPRYDALGVTQRINRVAKTVRAAEGIVIFVQHDDPNGGVLAPGSEGWRILPTLEHVEEDFLIRKKACDSFYKTELQDVLQQHRVKRLILTGCATDFCVDTTVRAAASRDYEILVVADGHTTKDRPHLDALSIIQHHNWMWKNLIHPHIRIEVITTDRIVKRLRAMSASSSR